MDLNYCLREKRGCKDYLPKDVPLGMVGDIIEAGTLAPSAGNLQNWVFIVVTEAEKKNELAAASLNQLWMQKAPVFIVLCNDIKKITDMYPTRGEIYATQACAIAAQNMMLKAADLGLSSCWVGAFNEESVRNILNIPLEVIPEMIITFGYSDAPQEPLVRDSVDKVTYLNAYGNREQDTSLFPLSKQGQQMQESMQRFAEEKSGFFQKLFKRR